LGETDENDVRSLDLDTIVNILEMIERKTSNNMPRITFYGEEVYSSEFVEEVGSLKAGFVANSFFVGIMGSVVVECVLEHDKLNEHIENYMEMAEGEEEPISIDGFFMAIFDRYDGFSSIFNLTDTFRADTYRRIVDEHGLRYENTTVTAKLGDVDVWNINRVKDMINDMEQNLDDDGEDN